MQKKIILTASVFGILSVIFGAFGAHALKSFLSDVNLNVWRTAVDYQFYHTFAILFLSTLLTHKSVLINAAYYCFTSGIVLFSGSLYILSTREIHLLSWTSFIGPLTPVGGFLFIAGWICLFISALKNKYAGV
ncbi:MAG TPA: DUF423 domain-containing protein [Sphingobacteriaceae bacterium]|nr:DUF423 domain-containing protein [Sphingobacteriaceae bacterium]